MQWNSRVPIFRRACILGLLVFMVSCQRHMQTTQPEDTLDRIRRTGQIEVCTVINPPIVSKDPATGQYSGIFVDLMNEIAQKMNAKVNWHETTYGNATSELGSKHCDIIVADLFATIPRAAVIAYTEPPLAYEGLTAIVRKSDARFQHIKSIFELDKPNLIIAVATGSTSEMYARTHFKRAKIERIDVQGSDMTRHLVEVSTGRADAALFGMNNITYYARRHPEVIDPFHNKPFDRNPLSWGVRQDDIQWLHFVETALQFLDTQGRIEQLEKKYNPNWMRLVKQYKLQ